MNAWPDVVLAHPSDATLELLGTRELMPLPVRRWHGAVRTEELTILERVESPVLDVGCGPGRHAAALRRFGHFALGIDTSPAAVEAARRRGATALNVSVFGSVPHRGRWSTALLLDGNIGIGGDPVALLVRIHELLRQDGRAFVEVDPPGVEARSFHARVRHAGGSGPRFPWAQVGTGAIAAVAEEAGFRTEHLWSEGGRWFVELKRRTA